MADIDKYWEPDLCVQMSNSRMRKTSAQNFTDNTVRKEFAALEKNLKKSAPTVLPHNTPSVLSKTIGDIHPRNLMVGAEVGIDLYAAYGTMALIVADKASGHTMVVVTEKADCLIALEYAINYYKSNGHPIRLLKSDNEISLNSAKVVTLLMKSNITHKTSPSHHKAYNQKHM